MNHSFLSIVEYGISPFLLVIITITIKYISKKSSRIKWKVFLSIGLEVMLMCAFGSFIFTISIYNHFIMIPEIQNIVFYSMLLAFVFLIFSVVIAAVVRYFGEYTNRAFYIQNAIGTIFLVWFLLFLSINNSKLEKYRLIPKEQSKIVELLKD